MGPAQKNGSHSSEEQEVRIIQSKMEIRVQPLDRIWFTNHHAQNYQGPRSVKITQPSSHTYFICKASLRRNRDILEPRVL